MQPLYQPGKNPSVLSERFTHRSASTQWDSSILKLSWARGFERKGSHLPCVQALSTGARVANHSPVLFLGGADHPLFIRTDSECSSFCPQVWFVAVYEHAGQN